MGISPIEIRHKLCRARLRRVRSALVGNKPKLPRDRRLHAGAIQNLTLDGRAINHFLRNELDHDPLPGIAVEMGHRSDADRSEERSVGTGRVSTFQSRWWACH